MTFATQLLDDLRSPTRSLRQAAPEAWSAFADLHHAAFADGALPPVVKELMALAIAVATHCDGCVAHHGRAVARLGATREQVAEALSVALLMGGGPASVTAPRAWEVYEHYAARNHGAAAGGAAPPKEADDG
ncbi:MAG TPA: carboxymuconolactone decarboxylase family protein [Acidimicrobiales bacterium]